MYSCDPRSEDAIDPWPKLSWVLSLISSHGEMMPNYVLLISLFMGVFKFSTSNNPGSV
jgi:hypothetical protein